MWRGLMLLHLPEGREERKISRPVSQSVSQSVSRRGPHSHSRGAFKSSGTERGRRGGGGGRISWRWSDRSRPPSLSSFTATFVANLRRTSSTAVHAYSIKMLAWSLRFSSALCYSSNIPTLSPPLNPDIFPVWLSLHLSIKYIPGTDLRR